MEAFETINKLHYIIDGSGNYYRIDGNNQLVIAENRDAASLFSLEEASERIGDGKKSQFYATLPMDEAVAEKSRDKAYNPAETDLLEYLRHFALMTSNIKKYEEELNQKLSEVDLEICDIMHLVELYNLSEEESLNAMALLKERREYRREVKDEMYRVDCFKNSIGTTENIIKAKDAVKLMKKLDKRRYVPRRLNDIFEGADLRKKDEKRENLKVVQFGATSQNRIIHLEDFNTSSYVESERAMEYTKRETVYDNKKTDWLKFAQMQVEFFADVEQHMCNLNIELDELEDKIEEMLIAIEDANYNVAQGYRAFKWLKELRNARKEKLEELACLDALTAGVDCRGMLEFYQESMKRIEEIVGKTKGEERMVACDA